MIFQCENNTTVELKIHNYEFSDQLDNEYDRNWLEIFIKIKSKDWEWETIDPSLLTWDVKALIEWFRMIANNEQPKKTEISNLEPNISFFLLNEYKENENKFKIKLDAESRPPHVENGKESSFIFNVNKTELKLLINELETELKKFPVRS